MGVLKPNGANANYSTSGQLSPLFNDPLYRTVGLGTRIFLGGAQGYVAWPGTQHLPLVARSEYPRLRMLAGRRFRNSHPHT